MFTPCYRLLLVLNAVKNFEDPCRLMQPHSVQRCKLVSWILLSSRPHPLLASPWTVPKSWSAVWIVAMKSLFIPWVTHTHIQLVFCEREKYNQSHTCMYGYPHTGVIHSNVALRPAHNMMLAVWVSWESRPLWQKYFSTSQIQFLMQKFWTISW